MSIIRQDYGNIGVDILDDIGYGGHDTPGGTNGTQTINCGFDFTPTKECRVVVSNPSGDSLSVSVTSGATLYDTDTDNKTYLTGKLKDFTAQTVSFSIQHNRPAVNQSANLKYIYI